MKIAVFTDVHGNLSALKNVLEKIKENKADRTIFLGDVFQRGHEEKECLNLLMASDVTSLKGNCEIYVERGVDVDPDVEYLRKYYDDIRDSLTEEEMHFVKSMPLAYEIECYGKKLKFSHFLFADEKLSYPYLQLADMKNGKFDQKCESESVTKYDLVVIGHSHTNFVKGNVVSVSATGLEGASYLMIDVDGNKLDYEHIMLTE